MPANFRHLGVIRLALPGARVIHATREPVGQRIALYEKLFTGMSYEFTYQPAALVAQERAYRRLTADWRRILPGYALEVDVAGFEEDIESAARRILDFVGLDWQPAVLTPPPSEPQLGAADPAALRANRAAHRAAWRRRHPEFWDAGGPGESR
jgi:hypothetical protein